MIMKSTDDQLVKGQLVKGSSVNLFSEIAACKWTSYCQLLQQLFSLASYFLDHHHFFNNSPARPRNHICCRHILLVRSLPSDDLLVDRLCNPTLAESRAQGRCPPRGWLSAAFILNVLFPILSFLRKLLTILFNEYVLAWHYLSFYLL